jgi:geranylgeranyl pyrophosphate synthase
VRGPLRLGAVLSRHPVPDSGAREYGTPLGLAFQLRDDSRRSATPRTGKPTGADYPAGKRNSLVADAEQTLGDANAPLTRSANPTPTMRTSLARRAAGGAARASASRTPARSPRAGKGRPDPRPLHSEGTTLLREADLLAIRDR